MNKKLKIFAAVLFLILQSTSTAQIDFNDPAEDFMSGEESSSSSEYIPSTDFTLVDGREFLKAMKGSLY